MIPEERKPRFGSGVWTGTKWIGRKTAKLVRDSFSLARPFSKKEKIRISHIKDYLKLEDGNRLLALMRQGKAQIKLRKFDWSFLTSGKNIYPKLLFVPPEKRSFSPDMDVEMKTKIWIEELDKKIRRKFLEIRFREFTERAWAFVPQFIAPNIIGMQHVKEAAALQLFSKEPTHILLLGDPGTGRTEVLRSAAELSPVSTFGSGASGAGLAVTVRGRKALPGLLPKAHLGVCCIDKLNLMKKEDYAALYNSMEKGFVTYDKAGRHYRFEALVKVLATANPVEDSFKSYVIEDLKKQMPFEQALLSRFHLTFVVKKASLSEFAAIAEKIVAEDKVKVRLGDIMFLRRYIKYVSPLDVEIPKVLADKITAFVTELKRKESELLFEVTPRTVVGITRLAKASARMEQRSLVDAKDLERVFSIMNKAYTLN